MLTLMLTPTLISEPSLPPQPYRGGERESFYSLYQKHITPAFILYFMVHIFLLSCKSNFQCGIYHNHNFHITVLLAYTCINLPVGHHSWPLAGPPASFPCKMKTSSIGRSQYYNIHQKYTIACNCCTCIQQPMTLHDWDLSQCRQ